MKLFVFIDFEPNGIIENKRRFRAKDITMYFRLGERVGLCENQNPKHHPSIKYGWSYPADQQRLLHRKFLN